MGHPADAYVQPTPAPIAGLLREDALEWARNQRWYHTLDFGEFVTPGQFDLRSVVECYGFPDDMTGMTVLDVGRANGFFAFEFARRGATVYATEIPPGIYKDFIGALPAVSRPAQLSTRTKCRDPQTGMRWEFYLARHILGLSPKSLHLRIEDLCAEKFGTFDVVFAGSLLNHIRDIAGALSCLRSVTGGLCITATPVSKISPGTPALEIVGRGTTWWMPNANGMLALTKNAGFEARIHNPALPLPYSGRAMDHVIVHGRPA